MRPEASPRTRTTLRIIAAIAFATVLPSLGVASDDLRGQLRTAAAAERLWARTLELDDSGAAVPEILAAVREVLDIDPARADAHVTHEGGRDPGELAVEPDAYGAVLRVEEEAQGDRRVEGVVGEGQALDLTCCVADEAALFASTRGAREHGRREVDPDDPVPLCEELGHHPAGARRSVQHAQPLAHAPEEARDDPPARDELASWDALLSDAALDVLTEPSADAPISVPFAPIAALMFSLLLGSRGARSA